MLSYCAKLIIVGVPDSGPLNDNEVSSDAGLSQAENDSAWFSERQLGFDSESLFRNIWRSDADTEEEEDPEGQRGPKSPTPPAKQEDELARDKASYETPYHDLESYREELKASIQAEKNRAVQAYSQAFQDFANDPSNAGPPPKPLDTAPKKYHSVTKVTVTHVAASPHLISELKITLIQKGFNYMELPECDEYTVFVFEGTKDGKKAARKLYKIWNDRAFTAASDSPICMMETEAAREMVPPHYDSV